jgi:DNA ligase-1
MLKQPMLAKAADLAKLRYPLFGYVKFDGIRAVNVEGRAMSRHMKMIPNKFVQNWFASHPEMHGYDGELIVGSPNAPDVCRRTTSGCMTIEGEPDFAYYIFDRWDMLKAPLSMRIANLVLPSDPRVSYVSATKLANADELQRYETDVVSEGYEGVILRDPSGLYKQGRSTVIEGGMLKLKRFEDAEATIVGWEERMHNGNAPTISETGHTKRSSHQGNMTGLGTMGALKCVGLTAFKDAPFNVGGFTAAEAARLWAIRDTLPGKQVTFKYFTVGCKDAPRHPIYKMIRED